MMKRKRLLLLMSALIVIAGTGVYFVTRQNSEQEVTQPVESEPVEEVPEEQPEADVAEFDKERIRSVVESWGAGPGIRSVTVMNADGEVLAEHDSEREFFAASIYKLYVAYIGYQRIDDGTYSPNESYASGMTRQKCLVAMIQESDSPCAEKMMAELGQAQMDEILTDYGISNTSMVNITTSSKDAAIVLSLLEKGTDLSEDSRNSMLLSLERQVYRDALPKGMPEATVRNKVGFRGTQEYHDVGIVELVDGRKMIVSVLTDGAGSRSIVSLGAELAKAAE